MADFGKSGKSQEEYYTQWAHQRRTKHMTRHWCKWIRSRTLDAVASRLGNAEQWSVWCWHPERETRPVRLEVDRSHRNIGITGPIGKLHIEKYHQGAQRRANMGDKELVGNSRATSPSVKNLKLKTKAQGMRSIQQEYLGRRYDSMMVPGSKGKLGAIWTKSGSAVPCVECSLPGTQRQHPK